jgi:hypothetical protein
LQSHRKRRNEYNAKLFRHLLLASKVRDGRKITLVGQEHPSPDVSFGSTAALRERQKTAKSGRSTDRIKMVFILAGGRVIEISYFIEFSFELGR